MTTTTFKDINVNYVVEGQKGAKNVVLLHGFLESLEIWKETRNVLSKKFRVISIDLLGHGKSDCLAYVHTMEEMGEAVVAVLKKEKIRKAIFVGHSLGGYVTLALADHFSNYVKGICMFNSTAKADSDQKKIDRKRAIEIIKKDAKQFINIAIPNLFSKSEDNDFKKEINLTKKIALKTSKRGIIAATEGMILRPNREIILKFIPCPVLFIIGKRDVIIPYKDAIAQSKLNENGQYYLSENGGHMCFFEDKESIDVLKDFVRRC